MAKRSSSSTEAKVKATFWQAAGTALGIAVLVPLFQMGLAKLGVKFTA